MINVAAFVFCNLVKGDLKMFSFGEKFRELWALIPTIATYWDYVGLANAIDDARTGCEITERDEHTLLNALNVFKVARGILDQ